MKKLILAGLCSVMLSCLNHNYLSDAPQPNATLQDLLGTWQMVYYEDVETQEQVSRPTNPPLGKVQITFKADSTASGMLNCNVIGFPYLISSHHIIIKNISTTLANCGDTWTELFCKFFSNPHHSFSTIRSGNSLIFVYQNQKRKVIFDKL
jgi:heat shock protein HslJ